MPTSISNVWTPDVWVQQVAEKLNTFPSLITSPLVVRSSDFDALASGEGITVNMPYLRDISGQADAIQVENTAPTYQVIGSGKQIAPYLNREVANDATALASQVSGADVVDAITLQLAIRRQKQRQTTLINILRGQFNFAGVPGAAAILSPVRKDVSLEAGASPAAAQLIDVTKVVQTIALLGELAANISGGGILMHADIRAALLVQDQISFEHYSTQEGIRLETYKGMRVFVSNALSRAGATSGTVYDTYFFAPGVVGWGEKPQIGVDMTTKKVDVASLAYVPDLDKNVEKIIDRSRFLLHVNGTKWTGAPAGQSATNAELAVSTNWALDYTTADRVGVAQLRTNG